MIVIPVVHYIHHTHNYFVVVTQQLGSLILEIICYIFVNVLLGLLLFLFSFLYL